MTDAPAAYLQSLSLGFILMGLAGLTGLGFFLLGLAAAPAGLAAAGAGLVWWIGVLIVTAPRQVTGRTEIDPHEENLSLRWINRSTQAAWIGAGLLEAALSAQIGGLSGVSAAALTGSALALLYGMSACIAIGLVGLGPLSAQISDLADWANESAMAGRLRAIALVVTLCGGYIVLAVSVIGATQRVAWLTTLHGAIGLPLFVAWPLTVGALLFFFFTLVQMSRLAHWALSNAATSGERNLRLKSRYEQARARADAQRNAGIPVNPPQDPRAP